MPVDPAVMPITPPAACPYEFNDPILQSSGLTIVSASLRQAVRRRTFSHCQLPPVNVARLSRSASVTLRPTGDDLYRSKIFHDLAFHSTCYYQRSAFNRRNNESIRRLTARAFHPLRNQHMGAKLQRFAAIQCHPLCHTWHWRWATMLGRSLDRRRRHE